MDLPLLKLRASLFVSCFPAVFISFALFQMTIPCAKKVYRLFGRDGFAIVDLITRFDEEDPATGERILCHHPFVEEKRCIVIPAKVERLDQLVFDGKRGRLCNRGIQEGRKMVKSSMLQIQKEHMRSLNPTPYKVSVSSQLFRIARQVWSQEAPLQEFR